MSSAEGQRTPHEAILLCGGRSERMGLDKALLEVDGQSMLERATRTLARRFKRILVSVAASGPSPELQREIEKVRGLLQSVELSIVPDLRTERSGPLAGLEAGLHELEGEGAFLVGVDVAEIDDATIDRLASEIDSATIGAVMPRAMGQLEPVFAFYFRRLLPRIERAFLEGHRGLQRLASTPDVRVVEIDDRVARRIFRPLNTPAEFEDFRKALPEGGA